MENQKLNMTSKTGLFEIKGIRFDNTTTRTYFDNKKDEFLFKLILEIKSKASSHFNLFLFRNAIGCIDRNKEIKVHIRYANLPFLIDGLSTKEKEEMIEFRDFIWEFVDEIYEIYSKKNGIIV